MSSNERRRGGSVHGGSLRPDRLGRADHGRDGDYTKPPKSKVPSVQWLAYKDGPGGQPLGPMPTSTAF